MDVTGQHSATIESALSRGDAARSTLVASWSRSARLHGLNPTERATADRMTEPELAQARDRMGLMIHAAKPSLDRLFQAVGGVGCCVLLADRDGIPLERRGAPVDDGTFAEWGLWLGTKWTEAAQGTNGIGTCLVEERIVTIDKNQHFLAKNTILSCMTAPLFDPFGQLAGVVDVSSARADLTDAVSALIVQALGDATQRIESQAFRDAYPMARMVMLPNAGRAAFLAVDHDDLVIGATRAARQHLHLLGDLSRNPQPAADLLGLSQPETLEEAERAVLIRALARAGGNASAAARTLGISRATFHRKLGPRS